jgi:hypothetical protein
MSSMIHLTQPGTASQPEKIWQSASAFWTPAEGLHHLRAEGDEEVKLLGQALTSNVLILCMQTLRPKKNNGVSKVIGSNQDNFLNPRSGFFCKPLLKVYIKARHDGSHL